MYKPSVYRYTNKITNEKHKIQGKLNKNWRK